MPWQQNRIGIGGSVDWALGWLRPWDESASSRPPTSDIAPQGGAVDRMRQLLGVSSEVTSVAIAIIDDQSRYIGVNRNLAALNGIPADEHFGRSICSVVPDIGTMLTRVVRRTLQTKLPIRNLEFSARVPFVDGPLRHWLGGFFPIQLASGVVGVAHTVIEITDRNRIEDLLTDLALSTSEPLHPAPLTFREADVLRLIGQGMTTKEIAALLSISAHTVGNHRKHICRKLNVHSTAEIAAYAAGQPDPSSATGKCHGPRNNG